MIRQYRLEHNCGCPPAELCTDWHRQQLRLQPFVADYPTMLRISHLLHVHVCLAGHRVHQFWVSVFLPCLNGTVVERTGFVVLTL